jgi:hypothetical protein
LGLALLPSLVTAVRFALLPDVVVESSAAMALREVSLEVAQWAIPALMLWVYFSALEEWRGLEEFDFAMGFRQWQAHVGACFAALASAGIAVVGFLIFQFVRLGWADALRWNANMLFVLLLQAAGGLVLLQSVGVGLRLWRESSVWQLVGVVAIWAGLHLPSITKMLQAAGLAGWLAAGIGGLLPDLEWADRMATVLIYGSVKPGEVRWVLYGFLAQSALLFALLCVVPAAKGYAERRLRVRVV